MGPAAELGVGQTARQGYEMRIRTDARRLVALLAIMLPLPGCGSRAGSSAAGDASSGPAEPGDASDASLEFSGPETSPEAAAAPIACDGGYYVEVDDGAGSFRFASACSDAGPDAPSLNRGVCVEDCGCVDLLACDGLSSSLSLANVCGLCEVAPGATCSVAATFIGVDGGMIRGSGTLSVAGVSADGKEAAGTYTAMFAEVLEGGNAAGPTLTGSFCVPVGANP
jgi:hypothetical protein